jgi:glycerophosphoryl diester phosphodiesterase
MTTGGRRARAMTRPGHLPPLKRVGHKGADRVAPGNTLASFEAALGAGVDMIEFDVLRLRTGQLVLAHDFGDAARRPVLTLEEGLDHFAGDAYAAVELDVDLKLPGYEREVVEAVLARGLARRTMVSTMFLESLDEVARLSREIRRGWTVPKVRRDYTRSALAPGAFLLLAGLRTALPTRAAAALRAERCDALMAHWRLVTPRLVRAVRRAGGELFVWTVDDAELIARLEALGLDGVITNDPGLFGPAAEPLEAS